MMEKQKIWELLGESAKVPHVGGKCLAKEEKNGYVKETLLLELNTIEPVPAYFVYPMKRSSFPVFIYHHSHGGCFNVGKEELFQGADYLQSPSFAETLTCLGCGVIAVDSWGFGERSGMAESMLFKEFLVTGKTLWGMRLYDSIAILDYLENRVEVQKSKIGAIGMSMGAMQSWWLAALDSRINCCVDLCGQVDLETLIELRDLDAHGFYYYIPRLLQFFSTAEIQSWLSPCWRFSGNGRHDHLTPIQGIVKLSDELTPIYQEKGTYWEQFLSSGGHQETAAMRIAWCKFVKEWLTKG